ncbi:dynamin family protein [Brachyspira sp.]|uniref:dynamin family protein n=1 Tax=Brachyspira sp. TaxID=1977261 RepID=UPI003D7D5649
MISKDYNWYREQVLNLYKDYVNTFKSFGEEVNESIRKDAGKIENKIFNLMVLGEAKSGKSTFINAYLGKEILPMDVRQCTSAIIKIHYGDEFKLLAKTADGDEIIRDNDNEIIEFLKIHASIDDKYRNIPVPTINNELLIKYGRKGKEISDEEIKQFTNAVVNDNIYGISINEYNDAIRNYIKEKAGAWGKIITEIDITYKLSKKMKDITIIDSPGIGAGGNFGEISEKYIENADAIIFIKYSKGQAV